VPEIDVLHALTGYRRRLRLASLANALVLTSALGGAILGAGALASVAPSTLRAGAAAACIAVIILLGVRTWRRWTLPQVARAVEARHGGLDNLLVTAEEIGSGRSREPHPAIRAAVMDGAIERLQLTQPADLQPLARPIVLGLASAVAFLLLAVLLPEVSGDRLNASNAAIPVTPFKPGDLRVVVTPPSYAPRGISESINPASVTVLEMSQVRFEVMNPTRDVLRIDPDGRETRFATPGDRTATEITASASRPVVIRQLDEAGQHMDRLVQLRVERDARPGVLLREPGKDLMFPEGRGEVAFAIEARDDVALGSLKLRYTRVSGSGETFTFEEGEWPAEIVRETGANWRARGVLSLEQLKLQDGDTLVYRAVARDTKPGADPSSSDTYLIEVGRISGVASTGFALPEERDRQAISQQMLIIKTERLHAEKTTLAADAFAERARLLAIEQRMVKAEFVFMTGGDVEDEVEEATHAHELAEGRLENTGQVELLAAIREMSRAEARLNAADTTQALDFERAALKALQRAFDRRRYLLRTLPERARIDLTRRLTGDLDTAKSSSAAAASGPSDADAARAREVLRSLSAAASGSADMTALASHLLAIAPALPDIQEAALRLTTAIDHDTRRAAAREAQLAVLAFLRARQERPVQLPLQRDVLRGRLGQELTTRGVRQ
jgi:hypothetical protein